MNDVSSSIILFLDSDKTIEQFTTSNTQQPEPEKLSEPNEAEFEMLFNTNRNKGDPKIHSKPMIFIREGPKQLETLSGKILSSNITLGVYNKKTKEYDKNQLQPAVSSITIEAKRGMSK